MQIKSNLIFNTNLVAAHKNVGDLDSTSVLIGSSLPNVLRIPAGATITLADEEWKQFEAAAKPLISNGDLTLVKAPELSAEDQEAQDKARMIALEAEAKAIKARQAKKAPASKGDK